jgi:hypothetical protein
MVMKISQAWIAVTSERQFEQHDAELIEKESRQIAMQRRTRRPEGQRLLSSVIVDRISLNHSREKEFQSNYASRVQTASTVRSSETSEESGYEQIHTMEKIVGGIIDKEVTIRKISRNEDIRIEADPAADRESSSLSPAPDEESTRPRMRSEAMIASQLSITATRLHFEEENALFSSQGQVTTEDGRVIDFSLDMSLDRSYLSRTEENTLIQRWQEEINLTDPLVISLDGNAPVLTDAVFEFDLDSDGQKDLINFTAQGSGFLALDKNADGVINDGSELFGPGTGNGFNELAAFDEDGNQWIDENDAVFSQLSVWTKDEKGNDRLITLKDAGIGAIALGHADTLFNMTDADNRLNGQMKQSGVFLFENGKVGSVHQVDLVSHEPAVPETEAAAEPEPVENRIDPGRMILQNTPETLAASEVEISPNPLQELLDRIEELKEKLAGLIDKMNPVRGNPQSRRGRHSSYDYFRPDPSVLISGRGRGAGSRIWRV